MVSDRREIRNQESDGGPSDDAQRSDVSGGSLKAEGDRQEQSAAGRRKKANSKFRIAAAPNPGFSKAES